MGAQTTRTSCHAMSDAPITVILNVGSGHGDASTCQRQIREGFESAGRAHQILVAESAEEVEGIARQAVDAAGARHHASCPSSTKLPLAKTTAFPSSAVSPAVAMSGVNCERMRSSAL